VAQIISVGVVAALLKSRIVKVQTTLVAGP
jgi:hypothetical protein